MKAGKAGAQKVQAAGDSVLHAGKARPWPAAPGAAPAQACS